MPVINFFIFFYKNLDKYKLSNHYLNHLISSGLPVKECSVILSTMQLIPSEMVIFGTCCYKKI